MKNRNVKQVLSGGEYQWEEGECKERGEGVNVVNVFCIHI
jgi:hypothetical protein